jgi:hypothetical protein
MPLLRKISFRYWVTASLIFLVMAFITFCFAIAKDEGGTLGDNLFTDLMAGWAGMFRFPAHIMFPGLFLSSKSFLICGSVLNCILYGLLTERLFSGPKNAADGTNR